MRAWLMLLVLGLVAGAGCLDDDSEADDTMDEPMDEAEIDPAGNVTLNHEFGASLGCTGDVSGTCFGLETGQDGVDGFFFTFEEGHIGMAFTTTAGNAIGDSDCWFLDASGAIIGDANQGQGPCAGVVPDGAVQMYLYSYAEPSTGMTLTFTP